MDSDSRGQAHTLEGVVAGIVLLASLVFALQATTVTPLSASTSNEYIGGQLRGVAEGTLATGAETGSLKEMVLQWDDNDTEFTGAGEEHYYVRPGQPEPSEFIASLERAYAEQGIAFNIYVQYEDRSGAIEQQRLLYQGTPTDNAVSVTKTVTLNDTDIFNRAPQANFEYTPFDSENGDSLRFNASESFDSDGTVTQYNWTFTSSAGGTSTGTGEIVNLSSGNYTASLRVTDNDGNTDRVNRTVTIEPAGANGPSANQAPRANFDHTPSDPEEGGSVRFDASGSLDLDGNITQYNWTITTPAGEMSTTTGETVTTNPLSAGNYTMSLRVADNDGDTDRIERTVLVEPPRNSDEYPSKTYFAPDISSGSSETPDTPLYNVITVEVVVWRL